MRNTRRAHNRFRRFGTAGIFGAVGLLAGGSIGILDVGIPAAATAETQFGSEIVEWEALKPLSINANGQTYGSMWGRELAELAPDLVEVMGNDGNIGYVYRELFFPADMPTTPEEALLWNETRANDVVTVPVFENDGVTQIDTFTSGGNSSTEHHFVN